MTPGIMSCYTKLNNAVKEAIQHRGLPQNEVARISGVSESFLSRIISGERNASLEIYILIFVALDFDLGFVLHDLKDSSNA
jgi:transcriptional regulator with XRE-family HTH domain